ncbi:hypothetical protein G6F65_020692 [Rhizopus arrhizus]|nr:hypothetical protein G6F65_020692 [Rhizopus arrhizus]
MTLKPSSTSVLHFQLDQVVAVQQLARQAQRADRVVGAVAAGGVGQQREFRRRDVVQQVRFAGVLADVGAADGDRDDFGAAGVQRGAGLFEVLVLAGADEQARRIGASGDGEGVLCGHGGVQRAGAPRRGAAGVFIEMPRSTICRSWLWGRAAQRNRSRSAQMASAASTRRGPGRYRASASMP